MPNFLIDSEAQLEKFLSDIVKEAIHEAGSDAATMERQKQKEKASELRNTYSTRGKKGGAEEVDEADDETDDTQPANVAIAPDAKKDTDNAPEAASSVPKVTSKKLRRASLNDIVKMLNVLRSGRSLKDKGTRQKLQNYLDGLTSGEKETLYAFITGLAEIMVAGESGEEALDPSAAGLTIQVKTSTEKKTSQPVKVQKGTSDAPIVVGERADTTQVRYRLRELMER